MISNSKHGLKANYVVDNYIYFQKREHLENTEDVYSPLELKILHAATTTGGDIVSHTHDATGIMVWPATHLLCQFLVWASPASAAEDINLGDLVLELGCGCGLVGIAALVSAARRVSLWVSTDVDAEALELCQKNFVMNGVKVNETGGSAWTRTLKWGCLDEATSLLEEVNCRFSDRAGFDLIVGADIVYPSTCGKVLKELFETIDYLLVQGGSFFLSFAPRDGPRSPLKLIDAASDAGFALSKVTNLDPSISRRLPPLLDSMILVLRRHNDAKSVNYLLGSDDCEVFPGIRSMLSRLEESSSEEEWDAPFDMFKYP